FIIPRPDPWLRMGGLRSSLLLHEEKRLGRSLTHRLELSRFAAAQLAELTDPRLPTMDSGTEPCYLQVPVVFSDTAKARAMTGMFRRQGIDLAPLPWQFPLHRYPRFQGRVRPATPTLPNSEALAPRLRLLPTHTGVSLDTMGKMIEWLNTES